MNDAHEKDGTPQDPLAPISKTTKERVLAAIATGEVTMRPRWHFILSGTLWGLAGVVVFLALLWITSFIIFVLRASGLVYAPSFGFSGLWIFMSALPWTLIFFTLLFVVLLEVSVRRFGTVRRVPVFYSAIGLIFIVALGSLLVVATGIHRQFDRGARQGHMDWAKPFYGDSHPFIPQENVFPGTIDDLTDSGFTLLLPFGESTAILLDEETRFPTGIDFAAGDSVVVLGERSGEDGTIHALGVRKIDPDFVDDSLPGRGMHSRGGSRMHFRLIPATTNAEMMPSLP